MVKKELGGFITTILLIIVLTGISGMTLKSIYQYYRGPEYKIDRYIRLLNQREYNKAYSLLSQASIRDLGEKKEIEDYYKKIYDRENKLVCVDKVGCYKTAHKVIYTLKYQYAQSSVKGKVEVVKEKYGWKVQFPFESSDVEIFAPLGAKVYLDSELLNYNAQEGMYELDHVLPGIYLLKVSFNQENYKDYYKALYIPKEKSYEVPYEMAYVKVNCAPNLKVSLGDFQKVASSNKVEFNDILLENYKVKVEDEKGYFKTQEQEIKVDKGTNQVTLRKFELTNKGKAQLEFFIKDFYNQYIEAISSHTTQKLNSYFVGPYKLDQLKLFSEWYVDKKDIEKVNMSLNIGESTIDEMGQIHTVIRETSELYNQEYNEILGEKVERCYKVILDMDTTINVLEADWKIIDRKIVQSLVAVKDQEGRWIQY